MPTEVAFVEANLVAPINSEKPSNSMRGAMQGMQNPSATKSNPASARHCPPRHAATGHPLVAIPTAFATFSRGASLATQASPGTKFTGFAVKPARKKVDTPTLFATTFLPKTSKEPRRRKCDAGISGPSRSKGQQCFVDKLGRSSAEALALQFGGVRSEAGGGPVVRANGIA